MYSAFGQQQNGFSSWSAQARWVQQMSVILLKPASGKKEAELINIALTGFTDQNYHLLINAFSYEYFLTSLPPVPCLQHFATAASLRHHYGVCV
jgi:hypothetical protein